MATSIARRPRRDNAASEPPTSLGGAEASATAELEALAVLPSPNDLTPRQREHVHALVGALRGNIATEPLQAAATLTLITRMLANFGPALTEDAWTWIEAETDPVMLHFIAALFAFNNTVVVGFDNIGAELCLVRRALLENRCLRPYALRVLLAPVADAGGAGVGRERTE